MDDSTRGTPLSGEEIADLMCAAVKQTRDPRDLLTDESSGVMSTAYFMYDRLEEPGDGRVARGAWWSAVDHRLTAEATRLYSEHDGNDRARCAAVRRWLDELFKGSQLKYSFDDDALVVEVRHEKDFLVLGRGQAREWADDASPIERGDTALLEAAERGGLFTAGRKAGIVDDDGSLLGDAWLVSAAMPNSIGLNFDPAVVAYCDAPPAHRREIAPSQPARRKPAGLSR